MFMVDIAGVRVLYTGDYSCKEDRHLHAAEILQFSPDICIIESTYGVQLHQPRNVREQRFTNVIHSTISQGGCVLIPAFALGRAQELLLILDEYWFNHPFVSSKIRVFSSLSSSADSEVTQSLYTVSSLTLSKLSTYFLFLFRSFCFFFPLSLVPDTLV